MQNPADISPVGARTEGAAEPSPLGALCGGFPAELGPDGLPHRGRPDAEERAALAAGFGAALQALRRGRGWSTRTLADRSGVSRRHIRELEAGTRRPRHATVRVLAFALEPGDPGPLAGRLLALAGGSARPDTARALRQRRRAYTRPVREARALEAEGWRLMDRLVDNRMIPTFYDDLDRVGHLHATAPVLRARRPPLPPDLLAPPASEREARDHRP